MAWQALLSPWAIGGGLFGLCLGIAALVALMAHRRRIGIALVKTAQYLFSPVGFFGLVIVVFMIISVLESGTFFNTDITHGAIFGLLGYALALGFDLVSIVCIQARLNAARMRDEHGAHLNLIGVCICAAVSAFANAAGSLQGYNPMALNRTPGWMQISAPWLGMVFPALIIILSITADHILDHTPTRDIDVTAFRARERKRVELLQVRLETEREMLHLETELSSLRRDREQASGNVHREWIFWRWLRPVALAQSSIVGDEHKTEIDLAVQHAFAALQERVADLSTTMHTLSTWSTERDTHLHALHPQMSADQEQERTLNADQTQRSRADAHSRTNRGHTHRTQSARTHEQQKTGTGHGAEDRENVRERLLSAFHQRGIGATDTDIAHESGYSRTTVARWRKRFVEQGQLPVSSEQAYLPRSSESEPTSIS